MNEELIQPLVSTENAAFVSLVESKLRQGEFLVALLRYSHHGGARSYFLLKSFDDFQSVLKSARGKDALSIFFSVSFPVQGIVGAKLKDEAIKFLDKVIQDDDEAVFVIRLDAKAGLLGTADIKGLSTANQIDEWFSNNPAVPAIIGKLAFWESNSDEVITAYVPSSDGKLIRGAY